MSAWINHVKKYCKEHKCSYKDGMKRAKATYKPQKGKGVWDKVKSVGSRILNKVESSVRKVVGAKGTLYPGEHHGIMQTKEGLYNGNWLGPGTKVDKRLNSRTGPITIGNTDPTNTRNPRTAVDALGMRHDLAVSLARNMKEGTAADNHFMKQLRTGPASKDTYLNKGQASLLWPKIQLDKVGLNIGSTYNKDKLTPAKRTQYTQAMNQLTSMGYGHRR